MKNPSVKENMEQLELSQTSDMSFKLTSSLNIMPILFGIILKLKKYKFYGLEIPFLSTNPIEV